MSLEQWLRNGWLQRAEPTLPEIRKLLALVDREIGDAQATGLSNEGRFEHAYNAALQLCMIALRASGFQVPKGTGRHKIGIDSLRLTLGESHAEDADHLERCSRSRGQLVYDGTLTSRRDADDLVATATRLREEVIEWLKKNHPELLP